MSAIAAIGAPDDLDGLRLVGVTVHPVDSPPEAVAAWRRLDDHVGLVVLTPDAAGWIVDELGDRPEVLTVVTP